MDLQSQVHKCCVERTCVSEHYSYRTILLKKINELVNFVDTFSDILLETVVCHVCCMTWASLFLPDKWSYNTRIFIVARRKY